jgi:hypoxanthine phosphoribosyltransferase
MKILINEDTIKKRVAEIAKLISTEFNGQPITVVGVLTGCLIFLSDLVRQLNIPVRICFVRASSYRGEATVPGDLKIDSSMLPDIQGRNILLVDDILDSGNTLSKLTKYLKEKGCKGIRTAVLLRKIGRQEHPIEPDYCGFEIPDKFVVGYGLDHNDEYRNLPYIGELD